MQTPADYIFAERSANVFAVLDGASIDGMLDQLYRYEPEFICLYRGELEPDIAEVAPYLVQLERDSAFTDWLSEGWGKHWGIFAVASEDLTVMRQHFRRFLTVHDSEGKPMLFRYYDPRVLRVFLPTCNAEELRTIFGPILQYIVEGENAQELLRFQLSGKQLLCNTKKLNEEK